MHFLMSFFFNFDGFWDVDLVAASFFFFRMVGNGHFFPGICRNHKPSRVIQGDRKLPQFVFFLGWYTQVNSRSRPWVNPVKVIARPMLDVILRRPARVGSKLWFCSQWLCYLYRFWICVLQKWVFNTKMKGTNLWQNFCLSIDSIVVKCFVTLCQAQ